MKTTNDIQTEPVDAALSMARQALYRFAAVSFLDPRANAWELLRQVAAEPLLPGAAGLIRQEPRAAASQLEQGELPLEELRPETVLERLPNSAAELNEQFERTFGLLVSSPCPPYETEYVNSKFTFQRSNTLADIAGFYRAFGLELSNTHPERHDHISLQLEFMAYLTGMERAAAKKRSRMWLERRRICHDAQRRFLSEHLAWWAPAFVHLLTRQNPGGFYEAAGKFLAALVPAERSLLNVPAPEPREIKPSTIERPEECEGCVLAT